MQKSFSVSSIILKGIEKYASFKNKFKGKLYLLKQRYDNCPFDKIPIQTRELENTILMNIITFAPYLNVPFIKFLLDNNIRLPLSSYKCDLYPSYFIDFDNDTIQKAFIFELEDDMVNMDTFRKKVLSPEKLEETNKNPVVIPLIIDMCEEEEQNEEFKKL